jgi:drug/metabolite transporter (DMT)-like permease
VSRRGWVLFIALSVIWGIPYLFIKVAVEHLSPAVLVCGRVGLACVVLLPVALRRGLLRPVLARWRWVLVFAVVEISIPFGLLSVAEKRLSSSLTGLLVAAVPLMVAGLSLALGLADRLDARRFLGLAVGLLGVAGLVGIDLRGGDLAAGAAVLGAAACYALGPIVADQKLAGLPSLGVTTVAMGANALGYLPWAIVTRPRVAVPWSAWASVGVLGVVCSAVAFLVFFALVAEVGPARTSVITYLNPAVAVLLGVTLLDEPFTVGIAVGFPLVILGSVLATRRSRPVPAGEPVVPVGPVGPAGPVGDLSR